VAARPDLQISTPALTAAPAILSSLAVTLALASPALAEEAAPAAALNTGWLAPIVDSLDYVLSNIETVYLQLGVPYSYGWSIITLTALVKIVTLPLTKKQVESALSVQNLKPRIDIIKERYGEDKDKIQKETSRLYEQAKVNPLAGCAPSILSIPIFLGLYRSLSNIANSGRWTLRASTGAVAGRCAVHIYTSQQHVVYHSWLRICIHHPPRITWLRCASLGCHADMPGRPCALVKPAAVLRMLAPCDIASMIHLEFYLFLEHLDATTTLQGVLYNTCAPGASVIARAKA
jgi:YidC/Oxa1 family membrane protein insertase